MTATQTSDQRDTEGHHPDGHRSGGPAGPPTGRDAELKALAERAGRELEDAPALDVLTWATTTFGPRFCVTSSMEDAVVAHLAARAMPGVDVVFLDTGYHFPETIGTRDAVEVVMDVNLITLTPAAPSPNRTPSTARGCTTATRTSAARCARSSRWRRA